MKKISYLTFVIGFTFSCGGSEEQQQDQNKVVETQTNVVIEEPPVENSFIIETGIVGIFKIRQPFPTRLPEALSSRKSSTVRNDSGSPVEHLMHVVFNSLEDVAEITVEKDDSKHEDDLRIIDILIISNYYETRDGVKVGTTLNQLVDKYSDTKIRYDGESGNIVAITPAFGNTHFIINPDGCNKKLSGKKDISLSVKNFNEYAKIKTIRVF